MARGFDSDTTLGVIWSKIESNWKIYYPSKPDGWMMFDQVKSEAFKSFIEELEERGYDTKTLRVSVKLKKKDT